MEDGFLQKVVQEEKLHPELMALCVWLSDQLKQVCNVIEVVSGMKYIFNIQCTN